MLGNLILETTNAPGTAADCNLLGPQPGRLPFSFWFGSGTQCYYILNDGSQEEWGIGTFTAGSPNKLTRTTVLKNSAGSTARLNFLGTTRVYNEIPAERALWMDNSGNVAINGQLNAKYFWSSNPGGTSGLTVSNPSAAADEKLFDLTSTGNIFQGRAVNDAYTDARAWLQVTRSGYSITGITLTATTIALQANVSISGTLNVAGALTAAALTVNGALTAGTLTVNGALTAGTSVQAGAAGSGVARLQAAASPHPGYLEILLPSGTRAGYVGYDDGANRLALEAEGGMLGWHVIGDLQTDGALSSGGGIYASTATIGTQFVIYGNANGRAIQFTADGWALVYATNNTLAFYNSAGGPMFYSDGATGDFHVLGNVVAANVSDERTKRNIIPYTRGLADLVNLRPITFSYNGLGGTLDDSVQRIGLVAQQAEPFVPECVFATPAAPVNPLRAEPSTDLRLPGQLSFDDGPLLYALLNAVRELADRVVALETSLAGATP